MEVFTVNTGDAGNIFKNSVEAMFQSLWTTELVAMMAIDQPDLIICFTIIGLRLCSLGLSVTV